MHFVEIFTLDSVGSGFEISSSGAKRCKAKFSLLHCSVVTAPNAMREGNVFSRARLSVIHSVSLSIHIYRQVGGWP